VLAVAQMVVAHAGWSRVRFPMVSQFSIEFFWPHYGHGVDLDSNTNEYQGYSLGLKADGA
jgi:hypothetical protein